MQQPKIIVAIRKRPLSKKEIAKRDSDIISAKNKKTIIVSEYKQKVDLTKYLEETVFNFDYAYDQHSTNEDIYQSAVQPLVISAFQGAKVTCFAYGQTGSGKTYTMNGIPSQGILGLYSLGAKDLFSYLQEPRFSHLKANLSFFKIYCGKLFDLLNKRQQLKIREDNKSNINIIGLQEVTITSTEQFMELLNYGASQRVTSQNSANAQSSRSHAILQIILRDGKKVFGKISFIDLAGNQRGADHMDMNKQTRIDGAQINKSLLSLKQCIRALDQGKSHTPFRGSKLTMVLKDSFIGFCRTVMIGNISPSSASSQNTLNTLRYADRVKQLRKPQDSISKQDHKAKQLMLPRQSKNAIKIFFQKDDEADDIQRKREEAQINFGIVNRKNQRIQEQTIHKQIFKQINEHNVLFSKKNEKKHQKQKTIDNQIQQKSGLIKYPNKQGQLKFSNKSPRKSHKTQMDIQNTTIGQLQSFSTSNNFISNQISTNSYRIFKQNNNPQFTPQAFHKPYHNQSHYQNYFNELNNYESLEENQKMFYEDSAATTLYKQEQFEIPNNWNQTIEMIQKSKNPATIAKLEQALSQNLLVQETNLIENHSNTLRKQIDIIKEQMSTISKMQMDRNVISTRKYLSFLHENIEEKISNLQYLRQKLVQFSYKLDQVEQLQSQLKDIEEANGEDEQLLDDLSY